MQVRQPTDCVTCEDIQSEFMDFERSFLNNLNVKRHGEQTGAPFSRLQPPCSGCTRGEQRELYHDIGEDNQEIRSQTLQLKTPYGKASTRQTVLHHFTFLKPSCQGQHDAIAARQTGDRFIDDLSQGDLTEKKRVRPYMDELHRLNKKPSSRNGKLFSEGREVTAREIMAYLDRDYTSNLVWRL